MCACFSNQLALRLFVFVSHVLDNTWEIHGPAICSLDLLKSPGRNKKSSLNDGLLIVENWKIKNHLTVHKPMFSVNHISELLDGLTCHQAKKAATLNAIERNQQFIGVSKVDNSILFVPCLYIHIYIYTYIYHIIPLHNHPLLEGANCKLLIFCAIFSFSVQNHTPILNWLCTN